MHSEQQPVVAAGGAGRAGGARRRAQADLVLGDQRVRARQQQRAHGQVGGRLARRLLRALLLQAAARRRKQTPRLSAGWMLWAAGLHAAGRACSS